MGLEIQVGFFLKKKKAVCFKIFTVVFEKVYVSSQIVRSYLLLTEEFSLFATAAYAIWYLKSRLIEEKFRKCVVFCMSEQK